MVEADDHEWLYEAVIRYLQVRENTIPVIALSEPGNDISSSYRVNDQGRVEHPLESAMSRFTVLTGQGFSLLVPASSPAPCVLEHRTRAYGMGHHVQL
eukprot:1183924-Prorocentrum_minimum.AAC.2